MEGTGQCPCDLGAHVADAQPVEQPVQGLILGFFDLVADVFGGFVPHSFQA